MLYWESKIVYLDVHTTWGPNIVFLSLLLPKFNLKSIISYYPCNEKICWEILYKFCLNYRHSVCEFSQLILRLSEIDAFSYLKFPGKLLFVTFFLLFYCIFLLKDVFFFLSSQDFIFHNVCLFLYKVLKFYKEFVVFNT